MAITRRTRARARRSGHRAGIVRAVVAVLFLTLGATRPAPAQPLSTGDLAGRWSLFQIATPMANVGATDVRTFSSPAGAPIVLDSTGAVTAGTVNDDLGGIYSVSGRLAISPEGLVTGALTLDNGATPGQLTLREGRILLNRHTIVGVSSIFGDVGLFTLVKLETGAAGTFEISQDLDGDWNYHEITPTNGIARTGGDAAGDASWVAGTITFHGESGCTEADLSLADGTVRAVRDADPTSFG